MQCSSSRCTAPATISSSSTCTGATTTGPMSCGNSIRCLGRFLNDRYRLNGLMRVQTGAGVSGITVHDDGTVTVDMGLPIFAPSEIPTTLAGERALDVSLSVEGHRFDVGCVS